jgi:hypothetical protein
VSKGNPSSGPKSVAALKCEMDQSGRATEWTLEVGRNIERSDSMGLPHLAALLTIGLASEAALHGALRIQVRLNNAPVGYNLIR